MHFFAAEVPSILNTMRVHSISKETHRLGFLDGEPTLKTKPESRVESRGSQAGMTPPPE